MSTTTAQTSRASRHSRLTLLQAPHAAPAAGALATAAPVSDAELAPPEQRRAPLRLVDEREAQCILVAGSDAQRRRNLVALLSARLPEGTRFTEATATWEVLEHAPSSRMVMLAGELDGSSTESVMHLIGNRHPQLPVLALG
jgi:hypothetical protein